MIRRVLYTAVSPPGSPAFKSSFPFSRRCLIPRDSRGQTGDAWTFAQRVRWRDETLRFEVEAEI